MEQAAIAVSPRPEPELNALDAKGCSRLHLAAKSRDEPACLALLVMSINVMLIVEFIGDPPTANVDDENPDPTPVWVLLLIVLVGIAYFGVCIRLVWDELLALGRYFTGRERQLSQTQITECMPAANDRTLCCAAPVY